MYYQNHDLKSNYRNADAAGDDKMKNDILMSEVARIIVSSPNRVIEHLNSTGFKVNGMPSASRLSEIVAIAIKESPKFTGRLAADIASGASFSASGCGPGFVQTYSGVCVPAKRGSKPMAADGMVGVNPAEIANSASKNIDPKQVADSVSTLTTALGRIFGGIKRRRDEKRSGSAAPNPAPRNPTKELQGKVNAAKGTQENPNIMRNVAIAIGAGIFIAGVIYFVKK